MKILYIAFKYDYGDPKRGFGFEHYNFYDSLARMNGGENQIIYFPFDEIMLKFGRDRMNQMLLEIALKEKPNFCFFCLFGEEIKKETIKKITQSGLMTLNWFTDDHWRFDNFSRHWAPCFSWIATTDPEAVGKYHKIGYKNVVRTQWACNHFLCKPLGLQKIYDVSFLGQPHGNRKKVIEKIRKAAINIRCRGWGWPEGKISEEEMIELFSQSKINLGLTNSSAEGVFKSLIRIFLKRGSDKKIQLADPINWLDNIKSILGKRNKQLKGRNYDIPGCGGFLLTEDADDYQDRYEDGKEVIIFKNAKDLVEKIKYYLERGEEREAIAKAGYERTLRDHTYEKRFNNIFKIIGLT